MLHQSNNFKELWWTLSNSWPQTMTYRSSHQEVFLENSCTFNNTQIILLDGTIGMELKELYKVPLRTTWYQNVLNVHQEYWKECMLNRSNPLITNGSKIQKHSFCCILTSLLGSRLMGQRIDHCNHFYWTVYLFDSNFIRDSSDW